MYKKILFLLLISFVSININAQSYGNEWINYSQKYYKFPVVENGIYRITYSQLISAGVPVSSINSPLNMQVFGRGKEIPLYITNESTGVFGPNDYIEFYAQKNDAWYDTVLYAYNDWMVNTDYSLFTDTAYYYFTWNSSVNNLRLSISNDVNYSAYNNSDYFIYDSRLYFNSYYIEGVKKKLSSYFISDPNYVEGEAWYDYAISLGESRTRNLGTKNVYVNGPAAETFIDVMGASDFSNGNNPDHHLSISVAGINIDTLYSGYKRLKFHKVLNNANLGSSTTAFTFSSINDINSGADRFAIPYLRIVYPHTTDLELRDEFDMLVDDVSSQSKVYYNFSNFNGGNSPVLYDLDNNIRIKVTKNNNNYQVLIPNSNGQKHCYIAGESNIHIVSGMLPISSTAKFTNIVAQNSNADFIIITNKKFLVNSGSYQNANDYALYKNSIGYNTLVVDIEELYHQFCYGIRKNPMAIRNFVRKMGDSYGFSKYRGLFIIGKSYRATQYRKDASLFAGTLVPTLGSPPSDIQILSGIIDNLYTPAIPIGRLSAQTLNHVDLYLDKVKMHEDSLITPQAMWMKDILHFSGGSTIDEQIRFSNYLKSYEYIVEDTIFGGNVVTFYKTSTDPIQINLSNLIKYYVNKGTSLMTFFGHAAGIGFDISIDDPSEYSNYGKYPFLLANSCYAGDIFQNTNNGVANSSEEFVLIRDKGMIGYLASITPGFDSFLNLYSRNFYKKFSSTNYGESIGRIIQQTINDIQTPVNIGVKEVCLEMTLHGDPSLRMNPAPKPDYMIDNKSVFYTPEVVSTEVDSFDFNIVVSNRGRAVNDSIVISIVRAYPNADSVDRYLFTIRGTYYTDTIKVKMPVNRVYGIGDNLISVSVDDYNFVDEMDESNNRITYTLNIKAADLSPVYPPKFAVVPNSNVTLKASTYYPFTKNLDYIFEIDTTDYFNSPFKQTHKLNSAGGVLEWSPNIVLQDSVVYYWRVSLDSNAQHNYNWRNSSFQYINSLYGWSQAHFYQFRNDTYQFTNFDEANRTYKFVDDIKIMNAQTGVYPYIAWTEIFLRMNYTPYGVWSCIPYNMGGLKIFVINSVSSDFLWSKQTTTPFGVNGNLHCTHYDYPSFDFPTQDYNMTSQGYGVITDSIWYRRIADFLGSIKNGEHVMIMSFNRTQPQDYPEYLLKAIDTIGSLYIRNIQNDLPFIIYGTKGIFGSAHEVIAANDTSSVNLRDSVKSHWNEGKIISPLIGPSKKWSSLHWHQHSLDNISSDSVRLRLIGIKADGQRQTIIDGIPPDSANVFLLNDRMPAATYPYCQLECIMKDDSLRTPAYLDNWRVIYQPVPEVAIDPITHYEFYADTLMQGDTLNLEIAYRNISDVDMDSLLVRVYVRDAFENLHMVLEEKGDPLLKNSTYIDTISISTMPWLGQCYLYVEINPINLQTGVYDQLEVTHLNNKGDIPFFVERDKQNPLLDVTFDGVHILDGDLVSATPEIVIGLKDESKFKAINDTSSFRIRIKKLEDDDFTNVNFSNPDNILEFVPAQLPDNSAQVIYRPKYEDGEYQLLVYANDASYNKSGDNGYKINFEIINKASITQMMNWPNPFSDKTHFVFTLTGSQMPDYLKIQILTVTGKIVREIDMDELGPLHIGRNITEYAWDGKDEFGDQLANGVYLYRVVTRLNGESIEHRNSGADKYFKKNFGKMYLMR